MYEKNEVVKLTFFFLYGQYQSVFHFQASRKEKFEGWIYTTN